MTLYQSIIFVLWTTSKMVYITFVPVLSGLLLLAMTGVACILYTAVNVKSRFDYGAGFVAVTGLVVNLIYATLGLYVFR